MSLYPHVTSPYVEGERCTQCRMPATHKVGEEDGRSDMHNWTAYVCCFHFGRLMGAVARRWCGQSSADEVIDLEREPAPADGK
jgi:hypothetical protein